MYRYRTPKTHDGVTRTSLTAMSKHLHKVGTVESIRLYITSIKRGDGTYSNVTPRVMVTGTEGKARFGGFLWGYAGSGPCGLMELLETALGFEKRDAKFFVENQPNDYFSLRGTKIRTVRTFTKEEA